MRNWVSFTRSRSSRLRRSVTIVTTWMKTWSALGGPVTRRWIAPDLLLGLGSGHASSPIGLPGRFARPDHPSPTHQDLLQVRQERTWVGWNRGGNTEHLSDAQAPAIWLGLTNARVENGCLRVVPRSHRLGMLSHWPRETHHDLASSSIGGPERGSVPGEDHDPSVVPAKLAEGLEAPFDVVRGAGKMSFHHPLELYGSYPNASAEPQIGCRQRIPRPGFMGTAPPST